MQLPINPLRSAEKLKCGNLYRLHFLLRIFLKRTPQAVLVVGGIYHWQSCFLGKPPAEFPPAEFLSLQLILPLECRARIYRQLSPSHFVVRSYNRPWLNNQKPEVSQPTSATFPADSGCKGCAPFSMLIALISMLVLMVLWRNALEVILRTLFMFCSACVSFYIFGGSLPSPYYL